MKSIKYMKLIKYMKSAVTYKIIPRIPDFNLS